MYNSDLRNSLQLLSSVGNTPESMFPFALSSSVVKPTLVQVCNFAPFRCHMPYPSSAHCQSHSEASLAVGCQREQSHLELELVRYPLDPKRDSDMLTESTAVQKQCSRD